MIDLAVIGGGPAGLATAIHAARAGLHTVIVEKRSGPIDKACGEGLMPHATRQLELLGATPAGRPFRGVSYLDARHRVTAQFDSGTGLGVRRTTLHAALLGVKLGHFPDYLARRRANAAQYLERLAQCDHVAEGRLVLPSEIDGRGHTWNQFTLRVANGKRDALQAHLAANNIGSAIYYPVALHQQECFAHLPNFGESLPVCEKMAGEVLSIPIYPELTEEQLGHVADTLANAPL